MSENNEPTVSFKIPPSPVGHKKSPSEASAANTPLIEPSNSSLQRRLSTSSAMSVDDSLSVNSPNVTTTILDMPPKTSATMVSSPSASASTSAPLNHLASSTSPVHAHAVLSPVSSSAGTFSPAHHSPSNSISSLSTARDWRDVQMNELVQRENLVFVTNDTTVENAFELLNKNRFTSIPIKAKPEDPTVSDTFDYADLNAYLLIVMGLIEPVNNDEETENYVKKARTGHVVPVKFAAHLGAKNELTSLKSNSTILQAVEILGSGVHRVVISDAIDPKITIGILSQRRLIRFIWENGRRFKSLEPFFQMKLSDLGIGPKEVVSINGDRPVIDALTIMHRDGVSSLAVTDNSNSLLGNISIVDVRLVTKSSQKHLLRSPCKQFLSTILNERGLDDGQDSYPVFHVTLSSTVGRTIAKLVATKSHRLWIVQPAQKKSELNAPSTPTAIPSPISGLATASGQLIGVVSLTDILNKLAHQAGKQDLDPHSARRQRRRSSSASTRSTASSFRRSISTDRSQR